MNIEKASAQLEQQGQAIFALAAGLTEKESRFKPDPETWSILEVLNHLVDEEVLDFRRHLEHILFTPDMPWPEIDPQGWVTEKKYNERQLGITLQNFKAEREKSIAWLATLGHPNWNAAVDMPWGSLTAGDMLASWLAHDLLHMRQLVELRYSITAAASSSFSLEYAGEW